MVTYHDLLDLHLAYVLIRHNIFSDINSAILSGIACFIRKGSRECVKKGVLSVLKNNLNEWEFASRKINGGCCEFVKDNWALEFFSYACLFLKKLLIEEKFQEAYDFVDAIHFLPLLVQENKGILPKNIFGINCLKAYKKKWGNDFYLHIYFLGKIFKLKKRVAIPHKHLRRGRV